MAVVRGGELDERRVVAEAPLVAGAQTELDRRRIRARRAYRTEWVDDRRAVAAEGVAGVRDLLAEVRARRVVVEQDRRIRLSALVPGCRSLQRQLVRDPAQQRGLDTLDEEVLAVAIEENVADHARVEEGDLDVVPVLAIHGPVPLQAMVEEFRLPADFIVRQLVGLVGGGDEVLRHQARSEGVRRIAVLIEPARAKALRVRVVHHDVRRDVPADVSAALEAGLGIRKPRVVQVVAVVGARRRSDVAPGRRDASLEAAETGKDAARRVVVEAEMARADRGRQYLRDQIEVDRREEGGLFGGADGVLIERRVRTLNAGVLDRRAGDRTDVREAAVIARRSGRTIRGARRNALVVPAGLIVQGIVFPKRTGNGPQPPVVRRADA